MRLTGVGTWLLVVLGWACALHAQTPNPADYRAYPLQHESAANIERMLRDALSGLGSNTQIMADLKTNQILLRGPEQAHQAARQLIDSADRPEPVAPVEQPIVKSYPCDVSLLQQTADRVRATFATFGVRVAIDPRSPQLHILAPPAVHSLVQRQLAALPARPISTAAVPRPLPNTSVVLPGVYPDPAGQTIQQALTDRKSRKDQFITLANSPVDVVETRLRDLLGTRLEPVAMREPGWPNYTLSDKRGAHIELHLDRTRNGIRLVGKQTLTDQMTQLIRMLDSPTTTVGRKVKVLPIRRADPAKLREAVEAYRTGARSHETQSRVDNRGSRVDYGHAGVELVAYMLQQPGTGPGADLGAEPPTTSDDDGRTGIDGLPQVGPDVDFEVLRDLDVIILRGRESDVDDVTRMIEEIERISAETVPEIEIYYLKHVEGMAITQVVTGVALDLLGGRQGRISVTPLVKPNALLLIGWGEAVRAVKDLIRKLDQPVSPGTQFRIFSLNHAPVATVGATIMQSFATHGSLSPVVRLTPDMRINALVVRAAPRDMIEIELLIQRLDVPAPGPVSQARMFKLQHSLANDLAMTLQQTISAAAGGLGTQKSAALELFDVEGRRLIRSGVLDDVQITPDMRTNQLVVSAPAESMDLVAALIKRLDSPSAVAQIKVFRIINGDATAMATMLQGLLPSAAAGGGTAPQLPGAEGESSLVPVRFSVDTRTNSIIATGSNGDLLIVEALLIKLDEEDVQQRINEVYRLRNAPALDVAESINEFLRSERLIQQNTPGLTSPFGQIESEVVVVPEIVSNSLIISASAEYYEEIMDLIEKLDEPPPQVMIQVLIAEVTLNDTEELGIELGIQDSILFDRSLIADLETITRSVQQPGLPAVTTQEIIAATNTPGFLFNGQANNASLGNTASASALSNSNVVGSQGLANFGVGRINSELGFGGLVLSASSDSVSAMIRALKDNRRLDVLSRPQIMTLDNQSAYIQVGRRVPRISGSTARSQGLVNTIELENVGLILGVTPRISPEGMIVMEIDAEKSELGPIAEGIPVAVSDGTEIRSPSINVTVAQTTVSAASGQTIVLGGLISKSESVIHRSVPWLGDIPVIGNLFRYDSQTCKRAELLIILTPHVVESEQEAEQLKRVEAARMHWCLADIHELHGDTGLVDIREGDDLSDGNATAIYPDVDAMGLGIEPPRNGDWDSIDVIQPPGMEENLDRGPLPAPRPTPAQPPVNNRSGSLQPPRFGRNRPPAATSQYQPATPNPNHQVVPSSYEGYPPPKPYPGQYPTTYSGERR